MSRSIFKTYKTCIRIKSNFLRMSLAQYSSSANKDAPKVIVKVEEGITTIGINRPKKKNCVNLETAKELMKAFSSFENDPNSPVAVFYGNGGVFCAGYDLLELSKSGNSFENADPSLMKHFDPDNLEGCGPMGPSRRFFSKPVIAAINGWAVAGGLELSLMCDMRVIEEDATMGVFCRRFGVPLLDGGTVRLPHLIGLSRAMDLILTGRPIKGKEALDIGLANRLVPNGQALNEAIKLAKAIAVFPQECMNIDRKSAYNAVYNATSFQDAIRYELAEGLEVITKESVKGATSFVSGKGRHGSFQNSKL